MKNLPRDVEAIYPLSSLQQGMLFHSEMALASGVYTEQFIFTLEGNLNQEIFKLAWSEVIRRHAVFRTMFVSLDQEKPRQVVLKKVILPWKVENWRHVAKDIQEARLEALLAADRREGFIANHAPLMRITLIHLATERYQLIWTHHHAIVDGWSWPIVFNDLFSIYRALSKGRSIDLLPVRPFQDHIRWLNDQDQESAKTYWRHYLQGFSAVTPLIMKSGGDKVQSVRTLPEQHEFVLSEDLIVALNTFVRKEKVTLNVLMQGVWALLLSRYSGQQDIVFGKVVSGRPPELEGASTIVGPFINTLPLRIKVNQEEKTNTWLKSLHNSQINQMQYESTPLFDIQRWSDIGGGKELFNSIFVFENYPIDSGLKKMTEGTDIEVANLYFHEQTNYPLSVVVDLNAGVTVQLNYCPYSFESADIERALNHYCILLKNIIRQPDVKLRELEMLGEQETQNITYRWNDTATSHSQKLCIHELFEKQAKETPESVAIVYEDTRLTYDEINKKSNQLAHYLIEQGVSAEVKVGLCLERSPEMIIGLLAILKAGGAYVPIDHEYPQQRIAYILEDSGITLLLTREALSNRLFNRHSVPRCFLDRDWTKFADLPYQNLKPQVSLHNLMYVIYTSGSTGKPKGVMLNHSSFVNHMLWMQRSFNFSTEDAFLQKTPLFFDAAGWEWALPLITGSRLILAKSDGYRDPDYLLNLIAAENVTILQVVPSLLNHLLEDSNCGKLCSLRYLFCGGEPLSVSLCNAFKAKNTDTLVCNLYGPTETTIDSTYWTFNENQQLTTIPIGRPIDNTQIYILDNETRIVPTKVAGELHIGGMGLGRCYLNRAALTATHFIPNPFGEKPGSRLYKTGDLARYLESGDIEFIGRVDNQVKVRGFRVELGEIESILLEQDGVREVAVLAHSDEHDQRNTHLTAYIVTHNETEENDYKLRQALRQVMPKYMVPSFFTFLKSMPLRPNGKINRGALPSPHTQSDSKKPYDFSAVRDVIEFRLIKIWQDLLGIETLGPNDDFFALGGHSILIMRMMSLIKKEFDQELAFSALLENSTISQLAEVIRKKNSTLATKMWTPLVSIQPEGIHTPLFCFHPGGGTVFCYADLAKQLELKEQPIFGLEAMGLLEGQEPYLTIEIAATHAIESIRKKQPEGPYKLLGWSSGGTVAFEMAQQLNRAGETVSFLGLVDTPVFTSKANPITDKVLLESIIAKFCCNDSMDIPDYLFDEDRYTNHNNQVEHIISFVRECVGKTSVIDLNYLERLIKVALSDSKFMKNYRPQVYPAELTLFLATEKTEIDQGGSFHWQPYAKKLIEYETPGNHQLLLSPPNVSVLADLIGNCLDCFYAKNLPRTILTE